MKPVIDPISGLPYLSHVNDIETIAALRAEVERLTDILIACCNAAGGQAVKGVSVDFLAHVPAEITVRIDRLTKELADAEVANRALTMAANELEKVRREREAFNLALAEESGFTKKAESERDNLREQLAAAQKDSERLNYMESHCSQMRLEQEAFGFNDVRGRVDAAMKKEATNG